MAFRTYIKHPSATLDYTIDWSNWLADGETIVSVVWKVGDGVTQVSASHTSTTTLIWLSGGELDNTYDISCRITTSSSRIDERAFSVQMEYR